MNYQEFILEVNKHREQKLMYQYGERNKPENYLPKDPVKDALKNKKVAQLAPKPVHPYGGVKNIMDLRTLGKLLRNIRQNVKYYNSQPKGSPLVPPGWFDD